MNLEENDIEKFMANVSDNYSDSGTKKQNPVPNLNDRLLSSKEHIYLYDLSQNKIIFQKGYNNLTGYKENETSLKFRKATVHPNDIGTLNRIEKAVILYCLNNAFDCYKGVLSISYRIRKKDGTYIKVLRKASVYDIDENGKIMMVLMKLTDISFLDNSPLVKWNFETENLDKEALKEQIYKAYHDFFTERERDVIKEIEKGNTNGSISKNLNISVHTVTTHRKNIFKKANKHNTKDLLLFCRRKGII